MQEKRFIDCTAEDRSGDLHSAIDDLRDDVQDMMMVVLGLAVRLGAPCP